MTACPERVEIRLSITTDRQLVIRIQRVANHQQWHAMKNRGQACGNVNGAHSTRLAGQQAQKTYVDQVDVIGNAKGEGCWPVAERPSRERVGQDRAMSVVAVDLNNQ